jgi:hypothetical protein
MKLAALFTVVVAFSKFARRKQKWQQSLEKPRIEMGKIACELINQLIERFLMRVITLTAEGTKLAFRFGGTIPTLVFGFFTHIIIVQYFTPNLFLNTQI